MDEASHSNKPSADANDNAANKDAGGGGGESGGSPGFARKRWKKFMAVRKFIHLALASTEMPPVNMVVGGRWLVGRKISSGAFGQIRIGKDTDGV